MMLDGIDVDEMRLDGSVATAERCESCTSVYAAVQYEVSYDPCTIVHIDQYDINSHMYSNVNDDR